MIARLWHGWTDPGDADDYERLLREELFSQFADEAGTDTRAWSCCAAKAAGRPSS